MENLEHKLLREYLADARPDVLQRGSLIDLMTFKEAGEDVPLPGPMAVSAHTELRRREVKTKLLNQH